MKKTEKVLCTLLSLSTASMLLSVIFTRQMDKEQDREKHQQLRKDNIIRDANQFQQKRLSTRTNPDFNFEVGRDDFDASFFRSAQGGKVVILFSYMRSGSTYLGDALFNQNDRVFYTFEPLGSLYVAMYGLNAAKVTDTDIRLWSNGTFRLFPSEEVQAITWMLSNLLTCNVTSLPATVIGHSWVWPAKLSHFQECVESTGLRTTLDKCHGYLRRLCGSRFGDKGIDQKRCFEHLWKPYWEKVTGARADYVADSVHTLRITKYRTCINSKQDKVASCLPLLEEVCRASEIRATKLVRGSMGTMDKLMRLLPNLYIIHLIRDPRGVVRSRRSLAWSQGLYDLGNVTKMAETYCRRVTADARQRKAMLQKYPDRLLEVIYDRVAENPVAGVQQIYRFLGMQMPAEVTDHLNFTKNESKSFKEKWSKEMTSNEIGAIEKTCKEFTEEIGFKWKEFGVSIDNNNNSNHR